MGTGLIFAAVVAAWLAYFVPLALRRYDEAARTGSIDRFSGAMRVLTHRESSTHENIDGDADEPADESPAPVYTRETARIAARRRRRTLLTLLASVVVVAALAAFAVVPQWAVAIPAGLVLAWLMACRIQVRRESGLTAERAERRAERRARHQERRAERAERRAAVRAERAERESDDFAADAFAPDQSAGRGGPEADDEPTVVLSGQSDEYQPHRKHVMERSPLQEDDLQEVEVAAVPVTSPTGATLWDPVPVTLPTYVSKPRAARTIRTIEFGEPGAWTSGHVAGEDTEVPRPAASETEHRPAVGD